jgi:hypothetical protein
MATSVDVAGQRGELRVATPDEVRRKCGLFLDARLTQEAACQQMWKDEKSRFSVLDYPFSK